MHEAVLWSCTAEIFNFKTKTKINQTEIKIEYTEVEF